MIVGSVYLANRFLARRYPYSMAGDQVGWPEHANQGLYFFDIALCQEWDP